MHSKKASIIIGLIVVILDLFLMAVYLQRQGEHTLGFIKSLYEEIKVYRADGESLAFLLNKSGNHEYDAANEKRQSYRIYHDLFSSV